MTITKFVHSCLLVEEGDKTFLIDPGIFSVQENALTIEKVKKLDYILITHEHPDHMYTPFMKELVRKFPEVKIVAPDSAVQLLQADGIKASARGDEHISVTPVPHEKLWDKEPPQNNLVTVLGRLASPGDSHHFTSNAEIIALPIQAPWGSTTDAVQLALQLKPKVIIPIHDWMWKDDFRNMMYQRLAAFFNPQGIEFKSPETGVPFSIG
jgi:L-ascorbate metabolism protein UlaG (beta-lactamase superfamily)